MIEIPLRNRNGETIATALVDDQDAELAKLRWHRQAREGYAVHSFKADGRVGTVLLHREVMDAPKGMEVDFINGDRLDCRRENLRIVTRAEQQQNLGPMRHGRSSKFRGVSFDAARGLWKAQAQIAGRKHHLGLFEREEDAATAASAFRQKHMPFAVEDRAVLDH